LSTQVPARATGTAADRWARAAAHSRYLARLLAARPELPELLAPWQTVPLDAEAMRNLLGAVDDADEETLRRALRRLRQTVMAQVIVRDLADGAPLAEVVGTMTTLAELAVNVALDNLHRQLAAQYGEPLDGQGRPQKLIVIGMGKLGGRELNVSSDIDLIFVYPEEGQTNGPQVIDAYDFFFRLGKRLIGMISDLTDEGQVFRVDMRLRPHGDSGPLVLPLDALENYLITQGREWERYAWIKARALNEGGNAQASWIAALEGTAHPFVFRKYLDFGAINAMRDLHAQIRREVARKEMATHVKLGPGGIREIEFIAQVFQLIRGGRDATLRSRPTLKVFGLLVERRLLPAESRAELAAAYDFLRRVEHRLQYFEDAQTHLLPVADADCAMLARSMGFADYPAFTAELDAHRAHVSRHFSEVFSDPEEKTTRCESGIWLDQIDAEHADTCLRDIGYRDPAKVRELAQRFRSGTRYQQLPAASRERLDHLAPRVIDACGETRTPEITLERTLNFLEAICRRGAYLALLQQHPQALDKIASMVCASSWATDYLIRHPIVLDELLDPRLLDTATDWASFRDDLERTLAGSAGDDEREMDILREMHHAQSFRLLAQDLAGMHTLERISDHLTELADILLGKTISLCWSKLRKRHLPAGTPPKFAAIGYGKLGGKELGYHSDLDLVFVYDDEDQSAEEIYARLAQRVITWLSTQTPAGLLFETDLRLRPNGDAGLIAISIASFREYQQGHAWVWEHQALTRARFCAGDPAVGARFEAIREEILRLPRELDELKREVLAMRQKMREGHGSPRDGEFRIKHDAGGIIDVEFMVQYLVLGHAHRHPRLTGNLGNIALLRIAGELGLIDPTMALATADAYRELRKRQHILRLNDNFDGRVDFDDVRELVAPVRALWEAIFG
jgi:glutamate-ammonia-ligase adenylyltransferase